MMNLKMKSGKVTINGKTFTGRQINIIRNKLIIDGVEQDINLNETGDIDVNVETTNDFPDFSVTDKRINLSIECKRG